MTFQIAESPLDLTVLRSQLLNTTAGAYASFEGWVRNRNEGQDVLQLAYEAYSTLAEKEGQRIIAEAKEKFEIEAAACVHRVGELQLGDMAVWVGVTAQHRDAAFSACRYIIDEVKDRVPIWKNEHYTTGPSGWINSE